MADFIKHAIELLIQIEERIDSLTQHGIDANFFDDIYFLINQLRLVLNE